MNQNANRLQMQNCCNSLAEQNIVEHYEKFHAAYNTQQQIFYVSYTRNGILTF